MKTLLLSHRLRLLLALLVFLPALGFGQYYNDVLSYKYNGTPTNGIKINTNIPFVSNMQMPTIMIEGYNYGTSQPIDLKIVYYVYADKYVRYKATSNSNYTPDIYLTQENGKVVLFIDDQSYYTRFHARVYANMSEDPTWFDNWTTADAPLPATPPAGQQVLVPYEEREIDVSQISLPVSASSNGVTQVFGPSGGTFVQNGTDVVGAIRIKLPVLYTNTMLKIRVEVFNYRTDQSFTAIISGYNYAPSTIWYNCSAQIITSSLNNNHNVYFGEEGGKTAIWIGEASTEWRYLKVRIAEVQATHQNIGISDWDSGWNVGLAATDFSANVNRTVTNTLPVSSGSSIWVENNQGISYLQEDARVGIGTANPTAELTVNGHIHAQEVRVYTAAGADFVFDPNYKLPKIKELEKFVRKNQHLPDIPSEKEMIENGLELGDMNIKLLQKVEELTLYIIELNKKVEDLQAQKTKPKKTKHQLKTNH